MINYYVLQFITGCINPNNFSTTQCSMFLQDIAVYHKTILPQNVRAL